MHPSKEQKLQGFQSIAKPQHHVIRNKRFILKQKLHPYLENIIRKKKNNETIEIIST
jgi:hypothetical protein